MAHLVYKVYRHYIYIYVMQMMPHIVMMQMMPHNGKDSHVMHMVPHTVPQLDTIQVIDPQLMPHIVIRCDTH